MMFQRRELIAGGVAIGLASAMPAIATAQARDVGIAMDSPSNPETSGTYVWAQSFGKALQAGGMSVKEHALGSIGGEVERLDRVSTGRLEVSLSDIKSAGSLETLAHGIYLPYLFNDDIHLDRALNQGGMFDRINAGTTKKGVRVLGVVMYGPPIGIFNTRKPITAVTDMSGLRIRALDRSQVDLLAAWGALGTVIAWPEVSNALQSGVTEGYINSPIVPMMFGHTGMLKFFTDARLILSARVAIASEDWYQSLTPAKRTLVNEAAARATADNRIWLKTRDKELQELGKAGITVTLLSAPARAEFQRRSESLYSSGPLSADQVEAWKKAATL